MIMEVATVKTDLQAATFLVGSIRSAGIEHTAIMVLADYVGNSSVDVSDLVGAGLATNIVYFLNQTCYNGGDVGDAINILEWIAMASEIMLRAVLDAGVMATITSSLDEKDITG
jgi:hypothetical protein